MADTINQDKSFRTILIVRNDSTTAWEESSYCLRKGELGIGYLPNGNVIVKTGVDGLTSWADCPQVEGVFTDNLTLTLPFGKHAPKAGEGNYTLLAKNRTVSDVLYEAFNKEEFTGLITGTPSASFDVTGGKEAEVGNTYGTNVKATLTYSNVGTYKYGAKDVDKNSAIGADIDFETIQIEEYLTDTQKYAAIVQATEAELTTSGKLEHTISVSSKILTDTADSYSLYGSATHKADVNRPLTNLGNWFKVDALSEDGYSATTTYSEATGYITANTLLNHQKDTVTYQGYRKMFCGCVEAGTTLNSEVIRGLNLLKDGSVNGKKASTSAFEVTAPIGATQLIVACPTKSLGYNYTLSKAEMFTMSYENYTSKFVTGTQVDVADVRGTVTTEEEIDGVTQTVKTPQNPQKYNIYKYEFEALKAPTKFKITLKSAKV